MFTSNIGLATPVAAGTTGNSNVINASGLTRGAVALASDHAGSLSVQRYIDAAGTIPISTAITAVIAAGVAAVSWVDGIPIGSIIVSFVNSAGAVANLTNINVLLSP